METTKDSLNSSGGSKNFHKWGPTYCQQECRNRFSPSSVIPVNQPKFSPKRGAKGPLYLSLNSG